MKTDDRQRIADDGPEKQYRERRNPMNKEQIAILDHTLRRAANGLYCGDSPDMQALVAAGLMESAGCTTFVPDEYFRMTGKGREALRSANTDNHALLGCPWCGHQPEIEERFAEGNRVVCWKLKCVNKDCHVNPETHWNDSKKWVGTNWNLRQPNESNKPA